MFSSVDHPYPASVLRQRLQGWGSGRCFDGGSKSGGSTNCSTSTRSSGTSISNCGKRCNVCRGLSSAEIDGSKIGHDRRSSSSSFTCTNTSTSASTTISTGRCGCYVSDIENHDPKLEANQDLADRVEIKSEVV